MQITRRRGLFPAALIVVLLLASSWLLLREGRLRDMDLARLGSLEAATTVAEGFAADEGEIFSEGMPAAVAGWGIYSPDGNALASWGTAPLRLKAPHDSPGVSEQFTDGILQTIRTMTAARPGETGGRHGSSQSDIGGSGLRRIILIDWSIHAAGNPELNRILGVSGLVLLTVLMLILQQRSAARLAAYRQEEERRKQLVQLGMAMRTLTHEIRNPLGTIKARTSLLRKTMPETAEEGLTIIDDEVNRLTNLTSRVRDWLADPRGTPSVFPAGDRIHDVLSRMEWSAILDTDRPGPLIEIDPGLFDSVITNLVRNAVESQEDSEDVTPPEVTLSVKNRNVIIEIGDRGRGLPIGDSEKLFDPFFTTKTRGSGVGLSLARQSIESADGNLILKDRDGGGTLAIVTLPLEKS